MAQVDGMLERIASLAKELKLANLEPQIAACRRQCNGRQGIDVAVFGRFKAGKSSFLNSLAGRAVLPIGVVPLTAVITRLRYGPTERAEARFVNGTAKAVPVGDIGGYVCEDANPGNEKEVAAVEVELPALKALAPLEFVDTPGLGSAFVHNTEAAMKWLPNVGAALVAVSCDAPLSERDLGLLEELRRHTPRIVLLLTKADLLNEAQRAEVLAFVERQLGQRWGTELPVFFYSVRPEEGALKEALERELLLPLVRDRGKASREIARHKLLSLAGQTRSYLEVALAAATQAESARRALREKLADERRQVDLLRAELNVLAREWSASALDWYLAQLQPTQESDAGKGYGGAARGIGAVAAAAAAAGGSVAGVVERFPARRAGGSVALGAGDVLHAAAQDGEAPGADAGGVSRPAGGTCEERAGRDADAARVRAGSAGAGGSAGGCGLRVRRGVHDGGVAHSVAAVSPADRARADAQGAVGSGEKPVAPGCGLG